MKRISPTNAYQSVYQVIDDLSEAISRCDSLQNYLSTSLFIFWAADELYRLLGTNDPTSNNGGVFYYEIILQLQLLREKDRVTPPCLMIRSILI